MNLVLIDLRSRGESLIVWPAQQEDPGIAAVLAHIRACDACVFALSTSIYDGIGTRQEARVTCDEGVALIEPLLQERREAERSSVSKRAAWIAEQRKQFLHRSKRRI